MESWLKQFYDAIDREKNRATTIQLQRLFRHRIGEIRSAEKIDLNPILKGKHSREKY